MGSTGRVELQLRQVWGNGVSLGKRASRGLWAIYLVFWQAWPVIDCLPKLGAETQR